MSSIVRSYALITGTSSGIDSGFTERLARDLNSPRTPKRVTYAATKACINPFTQILSDELHDTSVKVQALCPGAIITEFHTIQGIDPTRVPPEIIVKVEDWSRVH